MWLKGTTLLSIPHDRKEKVRGNKTKVRAWGGLGGGGFDSGSYQLNTSPMPPSLVTFLAAQESYPSGATGTINEQQSYR